MVVWRLARALPVDPGGSTRAEGRGFACRQFAADAVGRAVHQYRGFLRPAQCRRRRRLRDVCGPGKPPARARPYGPVGPERTGHAMVQRWPRRGRARRRAGRDVERLGRPDARPGRHRRRRAFPESERRAGRSRRDRPGRRRRDAGPFRRRDARVLPVSEQRLPAALVGGTDKMSSAVPVGLYRTYARLDEEFSYEAWCRAVRSGRTFLSGGPLVTLSVDGREPGGTVELSGPGTVSVHAAVRSIFPLRSLEVMRNGEVVGKAEANGGRQAEINEELRIDGNSWIACRAFGADYHLDEWGRRVFAHTSPVYLACGGDWTMTDPEGIRYIRTLVEGAREYVRHTAVRRSDQLTTHHHGEADHLAWLERPFAEALRALEERGRG